jgi:hypothetical protein
MKKQLLILGVILFGYSTSAYEIAKASNPTIAFFSPNFAFNSILFICGIASIIIALVLYIVNRIDKDEIAAEKAARKEV